MEKVVRYSILSMFMILFSTASAYANGGLSIGVPDWAKAGSASAQDMLMEKADSLMEFAVDQYGKSSRRAKALNIVEDCKEHLQYKDTRFCELIRGQKYSEAAQELQKQITERIATQQSLCSSLNKTNESIVEAIQRVEDQIKALDHQISAIEESFTDKDSHIAKIQSKNPDMSHEEAIKKFFDDSEQKLNELEEIAKVKKSNLLFLQDGSGEPPVMAWSSENNLASVKAEMQVACAPAVVKPEDFANGVVAQTTEREYNTDGKDYTYGGIPTDLTSTTVEVKIVDEVVEDSPILVAERRTLTESVDTAESRITVVTNILEGHSRKGEPASGIIPTINGTRQTLEALRQLAGVQRPQDVDVCIGLSGCTDAGGNGSVVSDGNRNQPRNSTGSGGGPQNGTTPGPQDGLAYGGGSSTDTKKDEASSGGQGSGAMAKTGGANGFGGFSMPSFGGMSGSGSSKNPTDYSAQNGSPSVGFKSGNAFPRAWSSDNGLSNNFNRQRSDSRDRNVASDNSVDSKGVFNPMGGGGAHSGSGGNFQGGAMNIGAQSGGNIVNQSNKRPSRSDTKGNKQVYSSRSEKAGGGLSLGSRSTQPRGAELEARMQKLKSERKLAGQDAFDPDKYIPRTHAERMALARASGRMGGQVRGKEWPKDISRSRDQDIFDLMVRGYRKHLLP